MGKKVKVEVESGMFKGIVKLGEEEYLWYINKGGVLIVTLPENKGDLTEEAGKILKWVLKQSDPIK